jgi:hypothetical protein
MLLVFMKCFSGRKIIIMNSGIMTKLAYMFSCSLGPRWLPSQKHEQSVLIYQLKY